MAKCFYCMHMVWQEKWKQLEVIQRQWHGTLVIVWYIMTLNNCERTHYMKSKLFYIITAIVSLIFKYACAYFYMHVVIHQRQGDYNQIVSFLLLILPLIIFLVLLKICFSYGKNKLENWNWKTGVFTQLWVGWWWA